MQKNSYGVRIEMLSWSLLAIAKCLSSVKQKCFWDWEPPEETVPPNAVSSFFRVIRSCLLFLTSSQGFSVNFRHSLWRHLKEPA